MIKVGEELWNATYAVLLMPYLTTMNMSDVNISKDQYSHDKQELPYHIVMIIIASYVILIPVIMVGNLLVILSYIKFDKLRTVTHMFICNLAVADFLVSLTTLPFSIAFRFVPIVLDEGLTRQVLTNRYACMIWTYTVLVPCGVSVLSLVGIAVSLFISMKWPLRYAVLLTRRRARWSIFFIWVYIMTLVLPMFIWNNGKSGEVCNYENLPAGYFKPVTIAHLIGPLMLMIAIYAYVFHQTKQIMMRSKQSGVSGSFASPKYSNAKMVKFTAVAVGVFSFCWIVQGVIYAFVRKDSPQWFMIVYHYGAWFAYSNSAMNPIIYSTKNPEYRTAFKKLLTCGRSENDQVELSRGRVSIQVKRKLFAKQRGSRRASLAVLKEVDKKRMSLSENDNTCIDHINSEI